MVGSNPSARLQCAPHDASHQPATPRGALSPPRRLPRANCTWHPALSLGLGSQSAALSCVHSRQLKNHARERDDRTLHAKERPGCGVFFPAAPRTRPGGHARVLRGARAGAAGKRIRNLCLVLRDDTCRRDATFVRHGRYAASLPTRVSAPGRESPRTLVDAAHRAAALGHNLHLSLLSRSFSGINSPRCSRSPTIDSTSCSSAC